MNAKDRRFVQSLCLITFILLKGSPLTNTSYMFFTSVGSMQRARFKRNLMVENFHLVLYLEQDSVQSKLLPLLLLSCRPSWGTCVIDPSAAVGVNTAAACIDLYIPYIWAASSLYRCSDGFFYGHPSPRVQRGPALSAGGISFKKQPDWSDGMRDRVERGVGLEGSLPWRHKIPPAFCLSGQHTDSVSRCSVPSIVYGIALFAVITQWPLQTRGCLFIKELYFTRNKTSHILTSYNYNLQMQLTICSS